MNDSTHCCFVENDFYLYNIGGTVEGRGISFVINAKLLGTMGFF